MRTLEDLRQKQALPLNIKVRLTQERIKQWINEYGEDGCYISFSGGKDSTVLLDIIRNVCEYKNITAVFVDVPTQYPELKEFVKTYDNVIILKPKISFYQVCYNYGFPLISKEIAKKYSDWYSAHIKGKISYVDKQFEGTYISKNGKTNAIDIQKYSFLKNAPFKISHKCCDIFKKEPLKQFEKTTGKKPFTAVMAEESLLRTQQWLINGCNSFNSVRVKSNPLSFWCEQDILKYIVEHDLKICNVYGQIVPDAENYIDGQMNLSQYGICENVINKYKTTGCRRTGCMLCGFGCHLDRPGQERFLLLKETHPGMYSLLDKITNNGITLRQAIEWINEYGNMNIKL